MDHPPELKPLPPKPPRDVLLVAVDDEEPPLLLDQDDRDRLLELLERRDRHLSYSALSC
jgi:hypothetical protein